MSTPSQPLRSGQDGLALTFPPALLELIVEQVTERMAQRERVAAEPWVGVGEAAAHLGCKPQRIYDLVCRRASSGIPYAKEGSRLLFKLSQLDRWIESGGAA
jgi:excisionase family DNA binding protein